MKNTFRTVVLIATITLPFTSVFGQDTTKPAFKPSGKLWGYTFGDYYYKAHADSMNRGTGEYTGMKYRANAFELRRVYLGYDYNISEKFSAEFLLSHEKNYDVSANRTVYVKAANVRWRNCIRKHDLVVGLSPTPTWSFISEKAWGYRSVERTVTDLHKMGNSNDLGIAWQGKLDSADRFGYNLMVGNGTGSKVENDRFKKFYGDVYMKFMKQKLIVDLYADYECAQLYPDIKSKMTLKLFVAWKTEQFTVGVEAVQQRQKNYANVTTPTPVTTYIADVMPFGVAVFAKGTIRKDKLAYFIRADVYDPNTDYDPENTYSSGYSGYTNEVFSVFGLDYSPIKSVHVIPNLWYNGFASKKKNVSGLEQADYDLVPRVTLHYIFK